MNTPISRTEGYRRGRAKEALGIGTVRGFLYQQVGVLTREIRGAADNYRLGDLRAPAATIEVKRQPIDPSRHLQNFVEIAEITDNPRHEGGFERLAAHLALRPEQLAQQPCTDRRQEPRRTAPLGFHPFISNSLTSIFAAQFTIYVNPGEAGPGHLYVYGRSEIVTAIRQAVQLGPLTRGAGNSNDDTLSVLIPVAFHRWTRPSPEDHWVYAGNGEAALALVRLKSALTFHPPTQKGSHP